jgi:hypothetical protein
VRLFQNNAFIPVIVPSLAVNLSLFSKSLSYCRHSVHGAAVIPERLSFAEKKERLNFVLVRLSCHNEIDTFFMIDLPVVLQRNLHRISSDFKFSRLSPGCQSSLIAAKRATR